MNQVCFVSEVTMHMAANLEKPAFQAYCSWRAFGEARTAYTRSVQSAKHRLLTAGSDGRLFVR